MSKILVLADSGFGKSTSLGKIDELGIVGLNPAETLIISCSDKDLPFPGWAKKYTKINSKNPNGNFLESNDPTTIIKTLQHFLKNRSEIINYVIDDFNFIMQDYYADNAKNKGYTTFQNIGYDVGQIFKQLSILHKANKNVIILAHPESYEVNGVWKFKMKTVGNMVDQYLTPVAKFNVVLMGHEEYDDRTGTVTKHFVTGYNGTVKGKAPFGMFEDIHIPNDMGYVIEKVEEYKTKE